MPVEKNYFSFEDDMQAMNKNLDKKKLKKFSYFIKEEDSEII